MKILEGRRGRASDLALVYGGTSLVLVALGIVLIRSGATRVWPRHVNFGLFVLACAVGAGVYALVNRQRALKLAGSVRRRLRLGEKMVGNFPGRLTTGLPDGGKTVSESAILVITNQRVMLYRPDTGLDESFEHELDEVVSARDLGPAAGPSRQACVMVALEFEDADELLMRMTLATAHEFASVRGTRLTARPRRVRVIILETHGPIPARAEQPLATILDEGQPALRQFVLEDHYLRVLDCGARRIRDLWWYFHWKHMQVGAPQPVATDGVPEDWLRLRLVFHGSSFIVVCGRPAVIRRVRDKAFAGGACAISSGDA